MWQRSDDYNDSPWGPGRVTVEITVDESFREADEEDTTLVEKVLTHWEKEEWR